MTDIKKKNNNPGVLKKTAVFGILLLFTISVIMAFENTKATDDVKWEVKLDFKEPDGAYDYVVLGGAHDANDGPPADIYDQPKPPAPPLPYVRAWFDDGLLPPHNQLMKDYQKYPDTYKQWNLTVQWVPTDYASPTTITISWNVSELDDSGYTSVILYDHEGNPLKNMTTQNNHSFTCPANEAQQFQIICQSEISNGKIDTIVTPSLILIFALIIIVIIVLLIVYWKTKR